MHSCTLEQSWARRLTVGCGGCSLQTQLSLQYKAEQIAVAVVHLAMKMLLSEAPLWDGRHWWQHCNVTAAQLQGALSRACQMRTILHIVYTLFLLEGKVHPVDKLQ